MGKVYCYITLLFFSFSALAQNVDTARKDTSKRIVIVDARPIDKDDKPLYVVDGIIYKHNIRRINPNDILTVAVLKGTEAGTKYGKGGQNGVIIITTKKYAIKSYQYKLSTYSKDYKNYLEINKNNDEDLLYVLNGTVLQGEQSEIIKSLFDVIEKVKTVDFMEKYYKDIFNNNKPIVVITTTK